MSRNLQALRTLSTLYVTKRVLMLFSNQFTNSPGQKWCKSECPSGKTVCKQGGPFGTGHAQMKPWLLVFAHGGHTKKENASLNKGGFSFGFGFDFDFLIF